MKNFSVKENVRRKGRINLEMEQNCVFVLAFKINYCDSLECLVTSVFTEVFYNNRQEASHLGLMFFGLNSNDIMSWS